MVIPAQGQPGGHPAWKKPVKRVKPRAQTTTTSTSTTHRLRQQQQNPLSDQPANSHWLHVKENQPILLNGHSLGFENENADCKVPRSSAGLTIEQYLISRKKNCNFHTFLSQGSHFIDDASARSGANAANALTMAAQDEAYSYLFQNLSGNCHGLNLVSACRGDKNEGGSHHVQGFTTTTFSEFVRIGAVVYVKPGTVCRHWEGIELSLERIFVQAAAGACSDTRWRFEGVMFVIWEAN